ncbi:hypothetical protein GBAR_LOCUS22435 [Geodia barretti]|uniref:Uncharacterized protein n=1 Tax=Geodia barretti TaxID=519541 RepID=A0AA35T3D6_GEOBA|nr:hypothetical protein GBAR_LOCUS22435 [Geodia barretti]
MQPDCKDRPDSPSAQFSPHRQLPHLFLAGSASVGPSLPTAPLPHSSSVKGSTTAGPYHQIVTPMTSQPPPPVSFPYLQTQHPTHVPFPFSAAVASAQYLPHHPPRHPQPNLYMGHVIPSAVTTCAPLFSVPVSPLSPPNAPYFIAPPLTAVASTAGALFRPPPNPFYYSSTPHHAYGGYPPGPAAGVAQQQSVQRWGSSPLSTQIQRTGQIQSVPPWFIFEQNRPEGKRLRLTEAINRSLSETPSHNPKLPVGWTKYACGQTDDQIQLTHRARLFLQSGRRQLTFDNINT